MSAARALRAAATCWPMSTSALSYSAMICAYAALSVALSAASSAAEHEPSPSLHFIFFATCSPISYSRVLTFRRRSSTTVDCAVMPPDDCFIW